MYKKLLKEMTIKNISKMDLACYIGISKKSLYNKLHKKTDFTFTEIIKIRKILKLKDLDLEILFKWED